MARAEFTPDQAQSAPPHAAVETPVSSGLLISLASLTPESLQATLEIIQAAFPDLPVQVASPDGANGSVTESLPSLTLTHYTPAAISTTPWIVTAADYLNLYELTQKHTATACLVLGSEAQTLQPHVIRGLADAVLANVDLAVPRYTQHPREGLVNSAILYPVSRALYGARPRFPLAVDLAVSRRMAERLATAAQRYTSLGQNDALLWPVAEASVAGFQITEIAADRRSIPQPSVADLNSLLAQIAGSLFSDVEAKAAYWQRSRVTQPARGLHPSADDPEPPPDIQPMIESFRLAYTNLREIWSLVLPPQSLLGLKKLSLTQPENFRMPDSLWARTVYDFILAYRLRTLNRGHLLGALTPLYLAWVASHLLLTRSGTLAEQHVEDTAAAFEADKPYLVSRWRWPDRFNP